MAKKKISEFNNKAGLVNTDLFLIEDFNGNYNYITKLQLQNSLGSGIVPSLSQVLSVSGDTGTQRIFNGNAYLEIDGSNASIIGYNNPIGGNSIISLSEFQTTIQTTRLRFSTPEIFFNTNTSILTNQLLYVDSNRLLKSINLGSGLSLVGNILSASGGSGWSLVGNSGTNPLTNFIGTTDNQPIIFKSNNVEGLRIFNGLVGINNSNPLYNLDLIGRTNFVYTTTSGSYGEFSNLIELNAPNASLPIALRVALNSSAASGVAIYATSTVTGGYFNVGNNGFIQSHIDFIKGIGINASGAHSGMEIALDGFGRGLLIGQSHSTVNAGEGSIILRRLRNNGSTTVSLQNGDELGSINFEGKVRTAWANSTSHNDDFAPGAYVKSFVDGTPSFNAGAFSLPSKLGFYTNDGTLNGIPQLRFEIDRLGVLKALPTFSQTTNSGTFGILGIDNTGKIFNTQIANPTSLTFIKGITVFNFGFRNEDSVLVTIVNANVTNANIDSITFFPVATSETGLEEFYINGLSFNIENIIDNVSFQLRATAKERAIGNYTVRYSIII
jgi:hypothetical protein